MAQEKETKREAFLRIAKNRTDRTVDLIRVIGNLSNTSNYEYDASDVKEIFDRIEKEIEIVKNQFKEKLER
ncbi:MAG: hypothetical protein K5765_03430 [Clostridia bacterium]|nr:hypothetical protein [Clostridia bacterium]